MWAYVLSLRLSMEMFALYSPGDVYGIVGNPTAAETPINNIRGIFGILSDGSALDYVESGRYKYKTKLYRTATKLIPGWRGIYESALHPELGDAETFYLDNLPGTFGLFNKIVSPMTEEEKTAKAIRKLKIEIRKAREEAEK